MQTNRPYKRLLSTPFLALGAMALLAMMFATNDAAIAEMDEDMQKTSFLKISYVGIQDKPISTLLVVGETVPDPADLVKSTGLLNEADDFGFVQLVVGAGSLPAILKDVADLLPATDPKAQNGPLVVSAYASESDAGRNWTLSDSAATGLLDQLAKGLSGDNAAIETFTNWRFRTNL